MSEKQGFVEGVRVLIGVPGYDWIPYWILEKLDELGEFPLTAILYRCQN